MLIFIYGNFRRMECRQTTYDNQCSLGMGVFAMKRVRVRNQHPIHIMNVSKRRYTCLIRHKEYQQG